MAKKLDVFEKNFADNERVRDLVEREFIPRIRQVRLQREQMEQDFVRFFNMWALIKDEWHNYNGRAKLYVPEVRKSVESQARQLTELAFPQEAPFSVSPYKTGSRRGASLQKSIRTWQMREANLRLKYHVFARQQCLYGTSPVRVRWDRRTENVMRSARDPKTGKIKLSRDMIEIFNGPTFEPVDIFNFYYMNINSSDLYRDGCFENKVMLLDEFKREAKELGVYKPDDIMAGFSQPYLLEEMNKKVLRSEELGLQVENQGYAGTAVLKEDETGVGREIMKTEIYARVICPEACLDGEDPELAIPMKITIYNQNKIGIVKRNEFFHQRPPYLVGHYILPNPDEAYGQGIPWAIQYQQYELNSKAEQAMDSTTLALNPLAIVDPAMAAQINNFEIEPGGIWYVSPQGVKFASMPDVSVSGYNAMNFIKGQMQDYSDRSPSLPSQLMGKSRTATQSSIVSQSMSIDTKAFQMQNELQVLQPLMEMWEYLTDQYADDSQIIMLLGPDAKDYQRLLVKKNMTVGQYRYFWQAASFLANRDIMARQMIDSMKVAGSLPPEVQQKLGFNYAEAFTTLFRDLWDIPNASKILTLPEEMQSQSPEVEHEMLKLGMEIEVLPQDNDMQHIAEHDHFIQGLPDGYLKDQMVAHVLAHDLQKKKKIAAAQEMQQRIQLMQAMAAQQQAQGGAKQQGGRMRGSGNRSQLSPNATSGDMASGVRP